MKKNMLVRLFVLALCLCLLMFDFAGCNRTTPDDTDSKSSTSSKTKKKKSSSSKQENDDNEPEEVSSTAPAPAAGDIAYGKEVFGWDSHMSGSKIKNISDGKSDTFWSPEDGHEAIPNMPTWLVVDLGAIYSINKFVLSSIGSIHEEESYNNTSDFLVQIGTDGLSFVNVIEIKSNKDNVFEKYCTGVGRYVRFLIYKGTQDDGDSLTRIANIEIFGDKLGSGSDVKSEINGIPVNNVLAQPKPQIVKTVYPTDDIIVASYIPTEKPYSIDKTGEKDCSAMLQRALNDCSTTGGGTVFLPVGKYRLNENIIVPVGVTLRGDWKDPDTVKPGSGEYGTLILAYTPSVDLVAPGLFRLLGQSGVIGMTVFYPNQSMTKPKPYPYTFEVPGHASGVDAYVSHQTVENVTLINSYRGAVAGASVLQASMGHGNHLFVNIKGTCLNNGLYLANSGDNSRDADIIINNKYWVNAGAAFNAPGRGEIDAYTRKHGIGMKISDAEWEDLFRISVSDYYIGIEAFAGARAPTLFHSYELTIENCLIGIDAIEIFRDAALNFIGLKLTNLDHPDSVSVRSLKYNEYGALLFDTCTFDAKSGTVFDIRQEGPYTSVQNCKIISWGTEYAMKVSGKLSMSGCEFVQPVTAAKKAVFIDDSTWFASLVGNTCSGTKDNFFVNKGCQTVEYSEDKTNLIKDGYNDYKHSTISYKPTQSKLFVVTQKPYNAVTNGTKDTTKAIQKALDDAGKAGGGVVYLPAGAYRLEGNLTVPGNVVLKGSFDSAHRADPKGTTFWVTKGKGTATPEKDTAAVTLSANAGIRGLNFYYPDMPNGNRRDYTAYPYAIRGNGARVYAIDVSFLNAYLGVDFSGQYSARCEEHYLRSVYGTVLKNAIHVGNSNVGWIEYCNFVGANWSFADFPNRINRTQVWIDQIMEYQSENLTVYKVGNCGMEYFLENTIFVGVGIHFYNQDGKFGNALIVASALDGTSEGILVDGTGSFGVEVLGSCICVSAGDGRNNDAIHVNGGTVRAFAFTSTNNMTSNIRVTGGNLKARTAGFFKNGVVASGGVSSYQGVMFKTKEAEYAISGGAKVTLVDKFSEFTKKWNPFH